VITKVLDAAIRAPSGSNQQSWEFVVIKDAAQRKEDWRGVSEARNFEGALHRPVKPEHMSEDTYKKLMASAYYLMITWRRAGAADRMPEAGSDGGAAAQAAARGGRGDEKPGADLGSSIYPRCRTLFSRVADSVSARC